MKYTHTIILLHGFSMNSEDMKYYKNKINKIIPDFVSIKYIIPDAPLRKSSIYNNKKYQSWYDYLTADCHKEPDININDLLETRKKIHKLIENELKYHKDPSKIFLCGMSQGCCVAIDSGITYPHKLGGIIGFKGHVIKKSLEDFKTKQKIWISHGKKDKTIFWIFAKKTYNSLKKKNPELKLILQDNINHSVRSGILLEMQELKKWFRF